MPTIGKEYGIMRAVAPFIFIGIILFLSGAAGAEETHRPPTAPPEYLGMKNPIDPATVDEKFLKKAARLYKRKCKKCHGEEGDGKGPGAEFLTIKPVAFAAPGYLKERKDGQLFWIMLKGSDGTDMKPRGPGTDANFSEKELWSLVVYIRHRFTR